MFDLWKGTELGILERKIFSVFKRLLECFVKLLKKVIVLCVGSNDCHVQERERNYFVKNGFPKDLRG